jgi:hypothetical protein
VHKGTDNEDCSARAEAEEGNMSSIFTKADRELLEQLRNPRKTQNDFFMEPIVEDVVEDDYCPSGVTA